MLKSGLEFSGIERVPGPIGTENYLYFSCVSYWDIYDGTFFCAKNNEKKLEYLPAEKETTII